MLPVQKSQRQLPKRRLSATFLSCHRFALLSSNRQNLRTSFGRARIRSRLSARLNLRNSTRHSGSVSFLKRRRSKTSLPSHPRRKADGTLRGWLPGCFAGQGCGLRRAHLISAIHPRRKTDAAFWPTPVSNLSYTIKEKRPRGVFL